MTKIFDSVARIKNILTSILSVGYSNKMSFDYLENKIAYSKHFSALENDDDTYILYSSEKDILNDIFSDLPSLKLDNITRYNECEWASDIIVNIFFKTLMTFESIFIFFPLSRIYSDFPVYHEMDKTLYIDEFFNIIKNNSSLSIVMKKRKFTNTELSIRSGLSSATINSLRNKKRDINKLEASKITMLSKILHVKVETLLDYSNPEFVKLRINQSENSYDGYDNNDLMTMINDYMKLYEK